MKTLYLLMFLFAFTGCSKLDRQADKIESCNDVSVLSTLYEEMIWQYPNDSVYNSSLWQDTIKVAFTRNGVFEDSIFVTKFGFMKIDSTKYAPTYIFMSAVGDVFMYDYSGKFIKFYSNSQHKDSDVYKP